MEDQKQIVIVGGGMSGISCAYHLLQHFKDKCNYHITIVEGNQRLGGRVHTFYQEDVNIIADLGASFVHGHEGNPLTELAERYNVELSEPEEGSNSYGPYASIVIDDDGIILDKQMVEKFEDLVNDEIDQMADEIRSDLKIGSDISIQEALNKTNLLEKIREELVALYKIDDELANKLIDINLQSVEGFNGSILKDLSIRYLDTYIPYPGGDRRVIDGYSKIFDGLFNEIKDNKNLTVLMGHIVNKVSYNSSTKKTLISGFKSESKEPFQLTSDSIVTTVSLGVLKANKIQFEPSLPIEKRNAIDRAGFGYLEKVILVFSEHFWPRDADWIGFTSTNFGQFHSHTYKVTKPVANTITMFYHRDLAYYLSKSDQELVDEALKLLARTYGEKPKETLICSKVTRWLTDPLYLGSYSFAKLGSSLEDFVEIGKPVEECNWYFAGEATTGEHFGFLHGAFNTGKRDADRLADKIKSLEN